MKEQAHAYVQYRSSTMLSGTATVGSCTSDLNEFGVDRVYDCLSVVRGTARRGNRPVARRE